MSFAASVPKVFGGLQNGGALCLHDIKKGGIKGMAEWLERQEITWFHAPVAPVREELADVRRRTRFPTVWNLVPWGPLYEMDLPRLRLHFPNSALLTHMSSSETGLITQMRILPQCEFASQVVPVGYPIAGKEVVIVDDVG